MNIDVYFAGFFDGEGCVMINKTKPRSANQNPLYQLCVTACQVNPQPIYLLHQTYKVGGIYKANVGGRSLSPAFRWVAVSHEAYSFLKRIAKHSIVKRAEIVVAMRFQEHVRANAAREGRPTASRPHSEWTMRYREECRVELQALKRRFRFHQ